MKNSLHKIYPTASNTKHPILDNQNDSPLTSFDKLLSPKEAAEFLSVSVKFIYEHIATGDIEAQPVGGRLKRIRLSTLEAWLHREKLRR